MKYYVILTGFRAFMGCLYSIRLLGLPLGVLYVVGVAFDVYLFICAHSLYMTYIAAFQENMRTAEIAISGNGHQKPSSYGSSGNYTLHTTALQENSSNEQKIAVTVNTYEEQPPYGLELYTVKDEKKGNYP